MSELQKIRDLARRYEVTPRTLRYYEEIGLLWSERTEDSAYRQYGPTAIARLEQILLLRRLRLSVREIQAIFASRDLQVAVEALARKLASIDAEMAGLAELRAEVERFLTLLRERGLTAGGLSLAAPSRIDTSESPTVAVPSEEERPMTEILTDLRIRELLPMTVASYRAESASPEPDAWAVMERWVEQEGLHRLPTTRYFGFNNPSPRPGNPVYGYEVWVLLPEGVTPPEPIQLKSFPGGLYAVTNTALSEIGERWERLVKWAQSSDRYALVHGQCLEESTTPYGTPMQELQLDLMLPVVRR